MDRRQRTDDIEEVVRLAIDAELAKLWTALPGIVESFNASAMTCTVQPAISTKRRMPDGTVQELKLPVLLDCPVQFPGGGGATLTFPVAAGDECLIVFASRCIDSWWQQGGVKGQAEVRMHDLSDGFVFVGTRSQPRKFSVSTSVAELRSDDGATHVQLDPSGQVVNVTAPGGITLNGVTIDASGNISGVGTLDATGEGTFNGHSVGGHTHSDPQGGTVGPATG